MSIAASPHAAPPHDGASHRAYTHTAYGDFTWQSLYTQASITAAAFTADNQLYQAGAWTNQNVTVRFTCLIPLANGGMSSSVFPLTQLTADGITGVVNSTGNCVDEAGRPAVGPG